MSISLPWGGYKAPLKCNILTILAINTLKCNQMSVNCTHPRVYRLHGKNTKGMKKNLSEVKIHWGNRHLFGAVFVNFYFSLVSDLVWVLSDHTRGQNFMWAKGRVCKICMWRVYLQKQTCTFWFIFLNDVLLCTPGNIKMTRCRSI